MGRETKEQETTGPPRVDVIFGRMPSLRVKDSIAERERESRRGAGLWEWEEQKD